MGGVWAAVAGAEAVYVGGLIAIDVAAAAATCAYLLGEAAKETAIPTHAPDLEDQEYPLPEFLLKSTYLNTVNIGVFGASGVGKSTLINSLRGLTATMPGAAKVGTRETTMEPSMYSFGERGTVRIWDLPGAGTKRFPRDTYIRDMGMRFFDAVLLVTTSRVTEIDSMIYDTLRRFSVPCFVVRSKIDVDIESEWYDHRQTAEVTKEKIAEDLMSQLSGLADVFLVSRKADDHDIPRLARNVLSAVSARRRDQPENICPVCRDEFTLWGQHQPIACRQCRMKLCQACNQSIRCQGRGNSGQCPYCRGSL